MIHDNFTYKELFREAYELTKRHFPFLLGLLAINIVVGVLTSPIPLVGQLVSMALTIATIYITLLIAKGGMPAYKDMLVPFQNYLIAWHYFLATLLVFLSVTIAGSISMLIGFALGVAISAATDSAVVSMTGVGSAPVGLVAAFGFAGIIFSIVVIYYGIRLSFYKFFIIDDEKIDPVESLRKSLRVTAGRFWKITGYLALLVLLNLGGLVAFVIGLLFTLPMTFIAATLLYKKLSEMSPRRGNREDRHIASE